MLDDNKQIKNKKKKSNKVITTKKKNTDNNINYSQMNDQVDKEVEDFKLLIQTESINANHVRKIRPKISVEWIQCISKI